MERFIVYVVGGTGAAAWLVAMAFLLYRFAANPIFEWMLR